MADHATDRDDGLDLPGDDGGDCWAAWDDIGGQG